MGRTFGAALAAILLVGCMRSSVDAKIVKGTSCKEGPMTYLGFRGQGQPPVALLDEIKKRFPDAQVLEISDGNLGVGIAEPHSWDVRARHEAAAAAVGWKGDVVDFPEVSKDCVATFHTPLPPTIPPLPPSASPEVPASAAPSDSPPAPEGPKPGAVLPMQRAPRPGDGPATSEAPRGLQGVAQLGVPEASVPMADLERVIATLRPRARACYQIGLDKDPNQKGRLTLSLKVASDGHVEDVTVESKGGLSSEVEHCTKNVARRLQFAAPGTAVTVRLPITLVLQTP
jgi:hypothetical protein